MTFYAPFIRATLLPIMIAILSPLYAGHIQSADTTKNGIMGPGLRTEWVRNHRTAFEQALAQNKTKEIAHYRSIARRLFKHSLDRSIRYIHPADFRSLLNLYDSLMHVPLLKNNLALHTFNLMEGYARKKRITITQALTSMHDELILSVNPENKHYTNAIAFGNLALEVLPEAYVPSYWNIFKKTVLRRRYIALAVLLGSSFAALQAKHYGERLYQLALGKAGSIAEKVATPEFIGDVLEKKAAVNLKAESEKRKQLEKEIEILQETLDKTHNPKRKVSIQEAINRRKKILDHAKESGFLTQLINNPEPLVKSIGNQAITQKLLSPESINAFLEKSSERSQKTTLETKKQLEKEILDLHNQLNNEKDPTKQKLIRQFIVMRQKILNPKEKPGAIAQLLNNPEPLVESLIKTITTQKLGIPEAIGKVLKKVSENQLALEIEKRNKLEDEVKKLEKTLKTAQEAEKTRINQEITRRKKLLDPEKKPGLMYKIASALSNTAILRTISREVGWVNVIAALRAYSAGTAEGKALVEKGITHAKEQSKKK